LREIASEEQVACSRTATCCFFHPDSNPDFVSNIHISSNLQLHVCQGYQLDEKAENNNDHDKEADGKDVPSDERVLDDDDEGSAGEDEEPSASDEAMQSSVPVGNGVEDEPVPEDEKDSAEPEESMETKASKPDGSQNQAGSMAGLEAKDDKDTMMMEDESDMKTEETDEDEQHHADERDANEAQENTQRKGGEATQQTLDGRHQHTYISEDTQPPPSSSSRPEPRKKEKLEPNPYQNPQQV
jgi:hypothetical protein